jgi:hypothetical protein
LALHYSFAVSGSPVKAPRLTGKVSIRIFRPLS